MSATTYFTVLKVEHMTSAAVLVTYVDQYKENRKEWVPLSQAHTTTGIPLEIGDTDVELEIPEWLAINLDLA